jgi:hypothetical protein
MSKEEFSQKARVYIFILILAAISRDPSPPPLRILLCQRIPPFLMLLKHLDVLFHPVYLFGMHTQYNNTIITLSLFGVSDHILDNIQPEVLFVW